MPLGEGHYFGMLLLQDQFNLNNKWPIHPRELNVYYGMAEKLLQSQRNMRKVHRCKIAMLRRLHAEGILEADDMPLAFDMTPSQQGEVHSNPWYSSINAMAAA